VEEKGLMGLIACQKNGGGKKRYRAAQRARKESGGPGGSDLILRNPTGVQGALREKGT